MRKLMWFAVGFAAACGFRAYISSMGNLPLILLSGLLFVLLWAMAGKYVKLRPASMAALGCLVGAAWFSLFAGFYLKPLENLHEREVSAAVTASDYSYETDYGISVDGLLTLEGKPYQVRLYLNKPAQIKPGDQVRGIFLFKITTPEGIDSYHQGKGLFLLAYQRGEIELEAVAKAPWWCFPAELKMQIKQILQHCFPEDVLPFAKALLLGDTSDLDYETDTALKLSGIRHVVAVSGLHISMLYGVLSLLTVRRRYLTALLGIPALVCFAAVAGFSPSVCRACIMVAVMMLSQVAEKEYDPPTSLAFAGLVLLTANPLAITSAGFQLSVGSVAGILLFNSPAYEWMKARFVRKGSMSRLQNWIGTSLSVTVSATSLTIPLSVFYFRTVSLVSVITNLMTIWVVTFAFVGILCVCICSLLSLKLAGILGWLLAWPIRFVLTAARIMASFPLAAVYTQSVYISLWLLFAYVLFGTFLLRRKKNPLVPVCLGTIGLCLALLASWLLPQTANCRLTMLDVGQGQCILLQSEGRAYLVDCGGDQDEAAADLAAQTLLSQGITRLDGIIATHYDRDHFGGIPYLLTRMDTELLLLPDTQDQGKVAGLPEISGQVIRVRDTLKIRFGDSELTVFGPVYDGYSNENSLCVLFDTEKCDILITGDRSGFGERMLLREQELPDVDVLVAGHHGAEDSATEELLRAVTPETVLISVSEDNRYGHPHPQLLRRLEAFGCRVQRTDINGTILIRR